MSYKKRIVSLVVVSIMVLGIISVFAPEKTVGTLGTTFHGGGSGFGVIAVNPFDVSTVYVDDDFTSSTPGWQIDHFSRIQDAINVVGDNGTIHVALGVYYENVVITKNLLLLGENEEGTMVNANGSGDVISVTADGCTIQGFTLTYSGIDDGGHTNCGVYCDDKSPTIINTTITWNTIGIGCWDGASPIIRDNSICNNSQHGLYVYSSSPLIEANWISGNTGPGITLREDSSPEIRGNSIMNNSVGINCNYLSGSPVTIQENTITHNTGEGGIFLSSSSNNTIMGNTITHNSGNGISLLYSSKNNTLVMNTITHNTASGIGFSSSSNNTITGNTITHNTWGLYLESYSGDNKIYHNNFINNTKHATTSSVGENAWDNGYPSGGNYWDNYTGVDANSDNIGDVPYFIPGGDNLDRYPLMIPNGIINQPPTCTLSASPTSGTVPLTVTFTMTASDPDGTIASWTLDINNDGTAEYNGSGTPPVTKQNIYQTAGTYTAKFIVTDNSGATVSNTKVITVNPQELPPPTCLLTANRTGGTAPITIRFFMTGTGLYGSITGWVLDINNDGTIDYSGPGNPPLLQDHTYTIPGNYTAKLTVTDNKSATASAAIVIKVSATPEENLPPIAGFTYSRDQLLVTFIDTSIDTDGLIDSWHWNFGDQHYSFSSNPTHEYEEAGNYTVNLTVTDDDGATHSFSSIITVSQEPQGNLPPVANFGYTPASSTIKTNISIEFMDASTDSDGTIVSWMWDFGDGSTAQGTPATHAYTGEGTYTVTLTVTDNDGETDSSTRVITIESEEEEGGGIPGFEMIVVVIAFISLLTVIRRRR